jgi:hypothetical protein
MINKRRAGVAKRNSEYQKRQEGGEVVFTVTPASAPKFGYMIGIGVVVTLIGLASLSTPGFAIWFLAMGGFALWYGWSRDQRPKAHQVPSTFRVGPTFIEAGGRRFPKDDIHRLQLRNGITDQDLPGIQTYTSNANAAAGMAQRARLATVANSLTLEAGGKATMLAGGMDETTAYGLLHEVCRVLDFKIS